MTITNLQKELIYRTTHRGCKEVDELLTPLAESNFLLSLDNAKISTYQEFLQEDDLDIYNWAMKEGLIYPENYRFIISEIKKLKNI